MIEEDEVSEDREEGLIGVSESENVNSTCSDE